VSGEAVDVGPREGAALVIQRPYDLGMDEEEHRSFEDMRAVAREHGDVLAGKRVGVAEDGDDDVFEAIPATIEAGQDAVLLHLGDDVYLLERRDVEEALAKPPRDNL
jgi:hypothetical protein